MLCTELSCGMDDLQQVLVTRKGRYTALQSMLKYKFTVEGSEQVYEFMGFARLEKLPTIPEDGVIHFTRLPDVMLKTMQIRRSSIRPFQITVVYCHLL